jgi:hypothetical protein
VFELIAPPIKQYRAHDPSKTMDIHNNNNNHNVLGLNSGSSVENTDNESNFDDDIEEEECRVCRGPVEEG